MNATKARQSARLPAPVPRGRHRSGGSTVIDSWTAQPVSLRVLRAFLGVTFVYAGIQKLADPNFLHAGTPTYIGTQLNGFAAGSPIGGLLRFLAHMPVVTGLGIAMAEIAIGIGTLVGIAPLALAAAGFSVNLVLTLSASWHIHPYFLGSDSMYAVAWLAYFAGVAETNRRLRRATVGKRGGAAPAAGEIGRRELLRGGLLAGATLVTATAAAAVAGSPAAAKTGTRAGSNGGGTGAGGTGGSTTGAGSTNGSTSTAQGTPIASLDSVPVGQAIGFQAPGGVPAALVRLGQDKVVAYSRVCTHAGCLVGYNPSTRMLICPCHGAEYDPAHHAEVVAGPAPAPLPPVNVAVDSATGQVVVTS